MLPMLRRFSQGGSDEVLPLVDRIVRLAQQFFSGVDPRGHSHSLFVGRWNFPSGVRNTIDRTINHGLTFARIYSGNFRLTLGWDALRQKSQQ